MENHLEYDAEGRIVRQRQSLCLETPFSSQESFLTPTRQFYVRSHFALPDLDRETWRLQVDGAVESPLAVALAELRELPAHTITATLECAGNGRTFLTPQPKGLAWGQGAVGTAEWTGPSLAAVLRQAGLRADSFEVILVGADSGEVSEEPRTPGVIPFARSLPLVKALHEDTLLAYAMNGEELSPEHGFPVRAIVPGWYAMASVKWLVGMRVIERPFAGYYQTFEYSRFHLAGGLPELQPLTELDLKAQISHPTEGESIDAGSRYTLRGAAWSGTNPVAGIEVSTDGGRSWREADLESQRSPYAWRRFRFDWDTPAEPGRVVLMARARDALGHVQPMQRDPGDRSYAIHHVQPIAVNVR